MVVLDILDAIDNAPPGDPPWGLRLCEQTGYGGGTVYPALDKLLKARWITDWWEEPQPADRPRRRFYRVTDDGRETYRNILAAREERRTARARLRKKPSSPAPANWHASVSGATSSASGRRDQYTGVLFTRVMVPGPRPPDPPTSVLFATASNELL